MRLVDSIQCIKNIDNEDLLRVAKNILDRKYTSAETIQLSDYLKQRIEKAKSSLPEGEILTNEQADELVNKWLKQ